MTVQGYEFISIRFALDDMRNQAETIRSVVIQFCSFVRSFAGSQSALMLRLTRNFDAPPHVNKKKSYSPQRHRRAITKQDNVFIVEAKGVPLECWFAIARQSLPERSLLGDPLSSSFVSRRRPAFGWMSADQPRLVYAGLLLVRGALSVQDAAIMENVLLVWLGRFDNAVFSFVTPAKSAVLRNPVPYKELQSVGVG